MHANCADYAMGGRLQLARADLRDSGVLPLPMMMMMMMMTMMMVVVILEALSLSLSLYTSGSSFPNYYTTSYWRRRNKTSLSLSLQEMQNL